MHAAILASRCAEVVRRDAGTDALHAKVSSSVPSIAPAVHTVRRLASNVHSAWRSAGSTDARSTADLVAVRRDAVAACSACAPQAARRPQAGSSSSSPEAVLEIGMW